MRMSPMCKTDSKKEKKNLPKTLCARKKKFLKAVSFFKHIYFRFTTEPLTVPLKGEEVVGTTAY